MWQTQKPAITAKNLKLISWLNKYKIFLTPFQNTLWTICNRFVKILNRKLRLSQTPLYPLTLNMFLFCSNNCNWLTSFCAVVRQELLLLHELRPVSLAQSLGCSSTCGSCWYKSEPLPLRKLCQAAAAYSGMRHVGCSMRYASGDWPKCYLPFLFVAQARASALGHAAWKVHLKLTVLLFC